MRARQPGIEFDGLLRIFLGDGIIVLAEKHPRGEEITGARIRWNTKHFRESLARAGVILRLDVANSENIGSIHIRAGIPRLHFLEWRDGLGGPSGEIVRESHQL